MKEIFNPAVTAEVATQLRETVSGFQAPPIKPKVQRGRKPVMRRVVEGIERRSDIPFLEPISSPTRGKPWSLLYGAMKVGEYVIFPTEKAVKCFQVWGISNKKHIRYKKLENGSYAAYRLRETKSKGGK